MKLTVFGATGGVGREVVRQALAAGHHVTAVVREPARFTVTGEQLDVFRSDLRDSDELRAAVTGRDAVLSGLGARTLKDAGTGIATRLTRPVLRAMEAEGVRRIVVVSAGPLGPEPADQPLVDRLLVKGVKAALKRVYADLGTMEADLADSATDWTSVRPPRLTDKPVTGHYRMVVGGSPSRGRFLARADVAHAMLAVLDDPATVRQGVGVAY